MCEYFSIQLPVNAGETLQFAASELRIFLRLLQFDRHFSISFVTDKNFTGDSFRLSGDKDYIITAANERAMLYGAYRFLREHGIEFFSPDEFDTFIPQDRKSVV